MNTSYVYETDEGRAEIRQILDRNGLAPMPVRRKVFIFPEDRARQDEQIPLVAPLWGFHAEGKSYKLSVPVQVQFSREGDFCFAENEQLVLYGSGETIREALEDLTSDILYFWKYYRRLSWDNVIGEGRRLKEIYETLVIKEQ